MSTWSDFNPPLVEGASADEERVSEFQISDFGFQTENADQATQAVPDNAPRANS